MVEEQIGFLYNLASSLSQVRNSEIQTLRSYYLMRCKDVTRGYGLPEKHFSTKVRCSRCCLEWNKDSQIRVKPMKLSKNQRHRIRSHKKLINNKKTKGNKKYDQRRQDLLYSNELVQICSFCKHSTITPIVKPDKNMVKIKSIQQENKPTETFNSKVKRTETNNIKRDRNSKSQIDMYRNAKDVFSLNNKNNSMKIEPKVIKNDKRKKDKFAGLCQQAVLASAKFKEEKQKQNKLNLFLKPTL